MSIASERAIAVVGAASSIGIRPYDGEHEARHLDRAPAVLRELGVIDRLGAVDLGDVTPAPYRDFLRPPGAIRNEAEVADYSRSLADAVFAGRAGGRFVLVLGGDCSIVLGSLLGASRSGTRLGLAYIDAHADFATPQESLTGSAASMCLALAVGRGNSGLARLAGSAPLVRPADVVLVGRRDVGQSHYGDEALRASAVLDLSDDLLAQRGPAAIAASALERLARPDVDGFWIHVDADVLDPRVMPAVDSPEPGGLDIDGLSALVALLAQHPRAYGMQLTIYDPALDDDRSCARRLVTFLERTLTNSSPGGEA